MEVTGAWRARYCQRLARLTILVVVLGLGEGEGWGFVWCCGVTWAWVYEVRVVITRNVLIKVRVSKLFWSVRGRQGHWRGWRCDGVELR